MTKTEESELSSDSEDLQGASTVLVCVLSLKCS